MSVGPTMSTAPVRLWPETCITPSLFRKARKPGWHFHCHHQTQPFLSPCYSNLPLLIHNAKRQCVYPDSLEIKTKADTGMKREKESVDLWPCACSPCFCGIFKDGKVILFGTSLNSSTSPSIKVSVKNLFSDTLDPGTGTILRNGGRCDCLSSREALG